MTVALVRVDLLMVDAVLPVPTTTTSEVEVTRAVEPPLEVATSLVWLELPEVADDPSDEKADEDAATVAVDDASVDDAVLDGCALLA